jgi:hypothetical protein
LGTVCGDAFWAILAVTSIPSRNADTKIERTSLTDLEPDILSSPQKMR